MAQSSFATATMIPSRPIMIQRWLDSLVKGRAILAFGVRFCQHCIARQRKQCQFLRDSREIALYRCYLQILALNASQEVDDNKEMAGDDGRQAGVLIGRYSADSICVSSLGKKVSILNSPRAYGAVHVRIMVRKDIS